MTRTVAKVHALVLVKERHAAKSRLATVLGHAERMALQDGMLDDVMIALAGSKSLAGASICSPDAAHAQAAARHGADFIAQRSDCAGMDAGALHGSRILADRGADLIVVIPGDLPLLDPAELDIALSAAATAAGVVVIPDRHGQGTNGLLFRVEATPAFRFGPGSFRNHLSESPASVPMLLRSFSLDIDAPDDLGILLDADYGGPARHSRAFLRSLATKPAGDGLLLSEQTP